MRYTVVWVKDAEEYLNWLWNECLDERGAITAAANRLDRMLANDPERLARPIGSMWMLTAEPLDVLVQIVPDDRMVRVLQVRKRRYEREKQ